MLGLRPVASQTAVFEHDLLRRSVPLGEEGAWLRTIDTQTRLPSGFWRLVDELENLHSQRSWDEGHTNIHRKSPINAKPPK